MEDKKLLKLLKRGDEKALETIINKYTGYVSAVAANQLSGFGGTQIVEELTADTFFALWQNRRALHTPHLRGWLGATARNKAKSHLRKLSVPSEALEEDSLVCSDDNLFDKLAAQEQCRILQNALFELGEAEREILIRYYYYNQNTRVIAEETSQNHETVKSRLRRGRTKLKSVLEKGGYLS